MPIYEFKCESCNQIIEMLMKLDEPHPSTCPHCSKGPLSKLISQSSFALKGSGWFKTLYSKAPEKKSSESKTAESKSDTPSDSKAAPTAS